MSYDGILLLSNIKIILNRTNITFVLKIEYIMYNVQDYIVLYNNTLCPVISEGWHFTFMWKILA